MDELIKERINQNLQRLRLSRIQTIIDQAISMAQENSSSYLDVIDQLLQEEVNHKDDRRLKAVLRASSLPLDKTIDEYDFNFHPDLDKRSVMNLFDLEFIRQKENVIFLGPPGVGKTHLAASLARKAAESGQSIYYMTMADLMSKLKGECSVDKISRCRSYYKNALVIIDEIGYMPICRQDAHLFFQFICYRYEKSSTVITSNKSFTEWAELFGDPVIATAMLDRLLHHCRVININGDSYRLKEFQQNKDEKQQDQNKKMEGPQDKQSLK